MKDTSMADAIQAFPPGTRLRNGINKKTYIVGVKANSKQLWMMCEQDREKGRVDAAAALRDFERVKDGTEV